MGQARRVSIEAVQHPPVRDDENPLPSPLRRKFPQTSEAAVEGGLWACPAGNRKIDVFVAVAPIGFRKLGLRLRACEALEDSVVPLAQPGIKQDGQFRLGSDVSSRRARPAQVAAYEQVELDLAQSPCEGLSLGDPFQRQRAVHVALDPAVSVPLRLDVPNNDELRGSHAMCNRRCASRTQQRESLQWLRNP